MESIKSLQALRAYAALWVVYRHTYNPTLTVGVFGIDIFFVISGFIMAFICWFKPIRPADFLARRLWRIVPLYWLLTLAVFTVATLAPGLLNSTTANVGFLLKSLLFIPYLKENGSITPMLPAGWTLNYEMLFYATVAASLMLVRHRQAAWLAAIALAGLALLLAKIGMHSELAVFYGNPIVFEFLFGVAVFWLWKSGIGARLPSGACVLLLLAAMLTLVAAEQAGLPARIRGGQAVVFGLPALVIVLMTVLLDRRHPVGNPLVLELGDASYSIYLSHVFVIEGLRKLVFPHTGWFDMSTQAGAWTSVAMAAVVGVLLYRSIERPLLHASKAWRLRRALLAPEAEPAPGQLGGVRSA